MKFHQHRMYFQSEMKVDGMYRIACLGDSVLLGQGVSYFDTLSAKLETFLNQRIHNIDIEALNLGAPGLSIYDEWFEYLRWGYTLSADMLIFTIAAHDVGLYTIPGQHEIIDYWDKEQVHLSYFDALLADIAQYAGKHDLPVIIAFYEYFIYDQRKRIMDDIRIRVERQGLRFITISPENIVSETMHVTEIDDHPSVEATESSARMLADYIVDQRIISSEDRPGCGDLYQTCVAHAYALRGNNVKPEFVLYRLKTLLADKHRLQNVLPDDRMRQAQHELTGLFARSIAVDFLEAYASIMQSKSSTLENLLFEVDVLAGKIAKNLFVLEKSIGRPDMACTLYQSVKPKPVKISVYEKIAAQCARWNDFLQETRGRFFGQPETDLSSELQPFADDLRLRTGIASEIILRYWGCTMHTLRTLTELIRSFAELYASSQEEAAEYIGKTFSGIARDVMVAYERLETITELMNIAKMHSLKNFRAVDKPVCECIVHIASRSAKAHVRVRVDAQVPFYPTIIELHRIIPDGQMRAYRFQFPLFTLGTINIGLFGEGEIEFDHMKLYLHENRQITFRRVQFTRHANGTFDSGMIFTTL